MSLAKGDCRLAGAIKKPKNFFDYFDRSVWRSLSQQRRQTPMKQGLKSFDRERDVYKQIVLTGGEK